MYYKMHIIVILVIGITTVNIKNNLVMTWNENVQVVCEQSTHFKDINFKGSDVDDVCLIFIYGVFLVNSSYELYTNLTEQHFILRFLTF